MSSVSRSKPLGFFDMTKKTAKKTMREAAEGEEAERGEGEELAMASSSDRGGCAAGVASSASAAGLTSTWPRSAAASDLAEYAHFDGRVRDEIARSAMQVSACVHAYILDSHTVKYMSAQASVNTTDARPHARRPRGRSLQPPAETGACV
jgi:hypothetical protein